MMTDYRNHFRSEGRRERAPHFLCKRLTAVSTLLYGRKIWCQLVLAAVASLPAFLPAHVAVAQESKCETTVALDGESVLPMHGSVTGFWLFGQDDHTQLAMMGHPPRKMIAALAKGGRITIRINGVSVVPGAIPQVDSIPLSGPPAEIAIRLEATNGQSCLVIDVSAPNGDSVVQLDDPRIVTDDKVTRVTMNPKRRSYPQRGAIESSPSLQPVIEQALIEWDWRMQDGIETPLERRGYAEAVKQTLTRGDALLEDLMRGRGEFARHREELSALHRQYRTLQHNSRTTEAEWETLWLAVHRLRRRIVLANPLADCGPLVFAKRVPSVMAHQLTQYYGYLAQPGGGLFVLTAPGRSMRTRQLADDLPVGSYLHPEVSYDGKTVYFAFCDCEAGPQSRGDVSTMDRHYHLYSVRSDGRGAKRLTEGPHDNFSPTCLPDGKLLFVSTMRGGYHRCGRGPCCVYTLSLADANGANARSISFHETNEWDPSLLNDGRVIYTRWDYVDRNAVFYQQLWSARQDGSNVQIYYGNNTLNPVGTWEARSVPDSYKVIATAAPHHGMTAGSIVLLDTTVGVDGSKVITRLTPDAAFPESEIMLMRGIPVPQPTRFDDPQEKGWGPTGRQVDKNRTIMAEERRWPGHCYRSPYPLAENYFLAAYSYDRLRGEPGTNRPNMFGIYLCDAFGNKELLYRDPNISSLWPIPLRPRLKPPLLKMTERWNASTTKQPEGTLFLQSVHESWPKLPDVKISQLRIIQVLPKTTPHANTPRVGAAFASPAKQVLGTVPVESDGSAFFRVPANTPLLFQALDERGRAVQTMRSLTYLQPGEQLSCVGCHEARVSASNAGGGLALKREPSTITPGPDGSLPLSYPILVQPVLDRHCVRCHCPDRPEGKVVLTGDPEKQFSRSYNALVGLVSYSAWTNPRDNYEPYTAPDRFGARGSQLTKLLDSGHYDVTLSDDDWECLVTWMDANALFYGTFNVANQAKQLRGERIAGPDLE